MDKLRKLEARVIIRDNPSYDHEQVEFYLDNEHIRTGAYRGKRLDSKICFVKCPACGRENYALNVSSGTCSWCGYDPNTDEDTSIVEDGIIT